MVARLDLASVSLAQKPKSAEGEMCGLAVFPGVSRGRGEDLTDFDIATSVEEDVIALDIPMDDVLAMQMCQALACLDEH